MNELWMHRDNECDNSELSTERLTSGIYHCT